MTKLQIGTKIGMKIFPRKIVKTPRVKYQLKLSLNMMMNRMNMRSDSISNQPGANPEVGCLNPNKGKLLSTPATGKMLGDLSMETSTSASALGNGSYKDLAGKKV